MSYVPNTITSGMLSQSFERLRADYTAAKAGRFRKKITGVAYDGSGADYHIRNEAEYMRIIEHARFFDRNDQVLGQAIDRVCNLVLREGPSVEPQTGVKRLDTELKKRFDAWSWDADAVDLSGRNTLQDLAWLALRHVIVDGDMCFAPTNTGHVEAWEAHRLRTPRNTKKNVVHGVLLNEYRRAQEYWVTAEDVDPTRTVTRVSEIRSYPAYDKEGNPNVFHVYNPKRFSQTRGVSALAPIFDTVGMHDDIEFAKLVQQQIVSCFGFIRQRGELGADPDATGAETTETLTDGSTRIIQGIAPGLEITSEPGETISAFSPNVPNAEFFDHVKLILGIIAVNLGIPLQVLLLDPSQTNFSGWRGAMDQAKPGFRRMLGIIIKRALVPIYNWKVRQFLVEDAALRAMAEQSRDVFAHKWSPPFIPYIEPSKDANAEKVILGTRLNTRRRILAEHGLDIDELDAEHVRDAEALIVSAIKSAKRINGRAPEAKVDWREIVNINSMTGGGANAYIEMATTEPTEPDDE